MNHLIYNLARVQLKIQKYNWEVKRNETEKLCSNFLMSAHGSKRSSHEISFGSRRRKKRGVHFNR